MLNSSLNGVLTYNEETDSFGIIYNGVWKNVINANFQGLNLYSNNEPSLINKWACYSYRMNSSHNALTPNIEIDSGTNSLYVTAVGTNATKECSGIVVYKDAIDFSKYKRLIFNVSNATTTGNTYWDIRIVSKLSDAWANYSIASSSRFIQGSNISTGDFEIDISTIDVTGYVIINCITNNTNKATSTIPTIRLLKD